VAQRRGVIWYGFALIWMALIYRASATPDLRAVPWAQWLGVLPTVLAPERVALVELVLRKSAHMVSFGVLAVLVYGGLATGVAPLRSARLHAIAFSVATLYAVSDEWHQGFVPTRVASATDVLIDAVGAVVGLVLVSWVRQRRQLRKAGG